MKYMLLIYSAESGWTQDERTRCMRASMKICEDLADRGRLIAASPLHSVATATCVRVREGRRLITDGPFAETAEQLGGYYIIDVDALQDAIDIAATLPPAAKGTVEIRPLLALPEGLMLPDAQATARDAGDANDADKQSDYIVLLYAAEGAWPPEDHAPALAESVELCHELHASGRYVSAAPLQPPASATCVRIRNKSRIVVDGPFPETKEQLGGYFLIHVSNLDQAIAIAARIPGSRRGTAEIRPLCPLPD